MPIINSSWLSGPAQWRVLTSIAALSDGTAILATSTPDDGTRTKLHTWAAVSIATLLSTIGCDTCSASVWPIVGAALQTTKDADLEAAARSGRLLQVVYAMHTLVRYKQQCVAFGFISTQYRTTQPAFREWADQALANREPFSARDIALVLNNSAFDESRTGGVKPADTRRQLLQVLWTLCRVFSRLQATTDGPLARGAVVLDRLLRNPAVANDHEWEALAAAAAKQLELGLPAHVNVTGHPAAAAGVLAP
jgi:hypothetical protein